MLLAALAASCSGCMHDVGAALGRARREGKPLFLWVGITCADEPEIQQIRLIENLQREDLTLIEEAHQLAELKALCPRNRVEDLSALVGRSPEWVAGRLAVDKLLPSLRDLLTKLCWPIGHYILLARLSLEMQTVVLADIKANTSGPGYARWKEETPSHRVLSEFLDHRMHLLGGAPWKKDDADLVPAAGACNVCPKRSSAEPLLFPEMAEDPKNDRCLDPGCFERKQGALIQLNTKKIREEAGTEPIFFRNDWSEFDKSTLKAIGAKKTGRHGDFVDCKKDDPKAQPAVIAQGPNAGQVKYVKPRPAGHSGNGNGDAKKSRPIDQETGKPAEPSTKERLAALLTKRKCRAVELWAERLEKLSPAFTGCVDMLLVHFGTNRRSEFLRDGHWATFKKLNEATVATPPETARPVFRTRCTRRGSMDQEVGHLWADACAQAQALGLPKALEQCWEDAVAEIGVPKALASVPDNAAMPAA